MGLVLSLATGLSCADTRGLFPLNSLDQTPHTIQAALVATLVASIPTSHGALEWRSPRWRMGFGEPLAQAQVQASVDLACKSLF
jgi:hypothetical protein